MSDLPPDPRQPGISPAYYDAVESGEKTFEVRRDDRGFQRGDILRLIRFDPNGDWYYQRAWPRDAEETRRRITWILTGGQFGIEPGYVVMGLAPVEERALATQAREGRE